MLFDMLADSMPTATHFYLNYVVIQWGTHALNSTRYIQLMKYWSFRQLFDDETARQMSEPEDQDYYGIGSRNARFNNNMIIALIFCSLSPLITVITLINFALCRVIYGYLMICAETRKPDLGGVFFVSAMKHLQGCLFIYIVLMVGVLHKRGPSYDGHFGPGFFASLSLVYYIW